MSLNDNTMLMNIVTSVISGFIRFSTHQEEEFETYEFTCICAAHLNLSFCSCSKHRITKKPRCSWDGRTAR